MSSIQRTFIILKPDAVQRGLTGEILARFERKGLKIVGMKFMKATEAIAKQHYVEHAAKPFFGSLVGFITSSPLVALVLEGDEAVTVARTLIGATDGRYTYYLYPEDLYAPGLHEYTLMPMHLHSLFSAAEMRMSRRPRLRRRLSPTSASSRRSRCFSARRRGTPPSRKWSAPTSSRPATRSSST